MVAGYELVDPGSGDAVGGGDFGGATAFDDDRGDDETGFGHPPRLKDCPLCLATCVRDVLRHDTIVSTGKVQVREP